MELKDFISQSIIDICLGIKVAQKTIYEAVENVPIAPAYMGGKSVLEKGEQKISFDIMVETSSSEQTQKQGDVKIYVVGGSINKESNKNSVNVNRIQFSVPFFPQALEKYEKK
ncbi:MAG: hypothetical protein LBR69_07145 [Endomicrobium sp.]|jgi:hypothetical protein|nr:hypothetical protein [Endomicrobium sp.]